jgi:hypothetical protein
MGMETLSEALKRLEAAGYTDDFRAESGGLRGRTSPEAHPPEAFRVDEIVRFEGDSDPSEESAVLALTLEADGTKGTYTVTYGSMMDPLDAVMMERLQGPG